MMYSYKDVGYACKCYRVKNGYTQQNIADDLCYSKENISAFENGRNDNGRILLWYIMHGMTIKDITEIEYDYK